MTTSVENLHRVRGSIERVEREAGRAPGSVTLVAVSKTFAAEEIAPVLEAGHRVFGENRVQEAQGKWPALRARFPDLKLHLIGPLQSNKTREAVALFDAFHAVDRPKIAEALASEMAKQGKALDLFVQVNTGEEPQKAGVMPRETEALVRLCREQLGLTIAGLMCIPPVDDEPAVHFAFLAKLAKDLGLPGVSMGMSSDYETAIALGATHVRVGSQIFGHRG